MSIAKKVTIAMIAVAGITANSVSAEEEEGTRYDVMHPDCTYQQGKIIASSG